MKIQLKSKIEPFLHIFQSCPAGWIGIFAGLVLANLMFDIQSFVNDILCFHCHLLQSLLETCPPCGANGCLL